MLAMLRGLVGASAPQPPQSRHASGVIGVGPFEANTPPPGCTARAVVRSAEPLPRHPRFRFDASSWPHGDGCSFSVHVLDAYAFELTVGCEGRPYATGHTMRVSWLATASSPTASGTFSVAPPPAAGAQRVTEFFVSVGSALGADAALEIDARGAPVSFATRRASPAKFAVTASCADPTFAWTAPLEVAWAVFEPELYAVRNVARVGSVGIGDASTPRTKVTVVVVDDQQLALPQSFRSFAARAYMSPYGDKFSFTAQRLAANSFQLTTTRIDAPHGWGQDLRVEWQVAGGRPGDRAPDAAAAAAATALAALPPDLVLSSTLGCPRAAAAEALTRSTGCLRTAAQAIRDAFPGSRVPEYARALGALHAHPFWLRRSGLERVVGRLVALVALEPLPESPVRVLVEAARKAAALPPHMPDAQVIASASVSVPGLGAGNFYSAGMSMWGLMGSRAPLFLAALRELTRAEDPAGLAVVGALLSRAETECEARRVQVYHMLLERLERLSAEGTEAPPPPPPPSMPPTATAGAGVAAAAQGSACPPSVAASPPAHFVSSASSGTPADGTDLIDASVPLPQRRVLARALQSWFDARKDKALRAVFLEPSRAYARAAYEVEMEQDVEVHGVNTALALVRECLGVRLPHLALDEDEVKGVADVVGAGMEAVVLAMCRPQHLGHRFELVPEARAARPRRRVASRHGFVFDASLVHQLVAAAVSTDRARAVQRQRMALYLEAFASCFSFPGLVEPLFTFLDSDPLAKPTLDIAYAALRRQLLAEAEAADRGSPPDPDAAPEDVRSYVWDVTDLSAELREGNARRLFEFLGVLPDNRLG